MLVVAISNYGELKQAVVDYLEDRPDVLPYVPDFIRMGADYLRSELRLRQQDTSTTVTLSGGVGTLPTDAIELIDVSFGTAPIRSLGVLTPRGASEEYPFTYGGIPTAYTVQGNTIRVYPSADGSLSVRCFQPYSFGTSPADSATTWLLTYSPNVYLRTALMWAAEFIKNDAEAAKQKDLADMLIAQLNRDSMLSQGRRGISLGFVTP